MFPLTGDLWEAEFVIFRLFVFVVINYLFSAVGLWFFFIQIAPDEMIDF